MMSRYLVTALFSEKSAPNDPKWPSYLQSKKYQHACYTHHWGPNFRPFRSTLSQFWVMAQFSEKCTEWPQMTLTCSRSKIPTCMLHKPPRLKFSSVSLYDQPFWVMGQFSEKCIKWPQMTLTCSRSKIPTCLVHTRTRPKFSSVSLYDKPFWVIGQFSEKCNEWPQMTLTCSRS